MVTVAISTLTITGATVAATGTTDNAGNTVSALVVDSVGNSVGPTACPLVGTGWSVSINCAALEDGPLAVTITANAAGVLAFDSGPVEKHAVALTYLTNERWATHLDVLADYAAKGISNAVMDMACGIAGDCLYLLTAMAWPGRGTDTVRPQARWRQWDTPRWWANQPGTSSSRWGFCSCNRGRDTGCNFLPEIKLPNPDVDPLTTVVKVDGTSYDHTSGLWRIDDGRWLVRLDGNGWPCCQNMLVDDTHDHTWSVTYGWGKLPDQGGVMAAAALGYELAIAFSGDASKCRLPKRITHMTRGSTSIAVLDPLTLFKDGLTGLTEVDLWIMSKMLGRSRRPATVVRPGQSRQVRRTG